MGGQHGRAYQYRIIELSDLSIYGFTSYHVNYNVAAPGNELAPNGEKFDAVVTNHYGDSQNWARRR